MTALRSGGLLAALAACAVALGVPRARADDVVRVSGTGSALGSIRRLAAAFEDANPGHRLQIQPSVGSSGAISAVLSGALDLGISGRPLEPAEQGRGLQAVAYARTPILFAAGPRAGVTGISAADMARIYRGELTAWPTGERIRIVLRPRTDVDMAILRAASPELSAALDAAFAREGLLTALTNQECDDLLARTPGALGPTSLSEVLTEGRRLVPLDWNGVAPTVANLASGAYPLSKTLHVVSRVPAAAGARRFLAFLGTPEARKILEETGNLPLPAPPRGDADVDRPR
jgi:phosphate transport system substrate-binding protein